MGYQRMKHMKNIKEFNPTQYDTYTANKNDDGIILIHRIKKNSDVEDFCKTNFNN